MNETLPEPPIDEIDSVRDVLRTLKCESPSFNSRRATLTALGISSGAPLARPRLPRPVPKIRPVVIRWLTFGVIAGLTLAGLLRWLGL